ncbi:MAG TPA: GNAT family N-acetyltransferase [Desulfosporosinus sp.]
MEEVIIHDGLEKMDFEKVTKMLSTAFWSPGIKIDEVKKGAENSALVVGAFMPDQSQVGYARVISDRTRFAYIVDVYVDENYRRRGIGQKLIKYILAHHELQEVYQWLLITKDAHEVYRKVGFETIARPLAWMEIRKERPNR